MLCHLLAAHQQVALHAGTTDLSLVLTALSISGNPSPATCCSHPCCFEGLICFMHLPGFMMSSFEVDSEGHKAQGGAGLPFHSQEDNPLAALHHLHQVIYCYVHHTTS